MVPDSSPALDGVVLGGPGREVRVVGDGRQSGGGSVSIENMNEAVGVGRQDVDGFGTGLGGGSIIGVPGRTGGRSATVER